METFIAGNVLMDSPNCGRDVLEVYMEQYSTISEAGEVVCRDITLECRRQMRGTAAAISLVGVTLTDD